MVFLFYQVIDKLPSLSSLLSEGNKITRWYMYQENLLQVNVQKYQSMLLHESEANNINLHTGVNIEKLNSFKLFGVLLDSGINFSEHISSVCKKASQQMRVLRRLRKLMPTHANKLQLYKAAILPHLTYCSTIWHFCRASDKRKASGNCDSQAVFTAKKNKLPSQIQDLFMLKANRDRAYS